mmetsp:Transcript_39923/g.103000  ORF Transcript_39923/g.103000 Transcript_39923/m.103000 type:complete len:724 (-) Transcript_39923:978-3149(-)
MGAALTKKTAQISPVHVDSPGKRLSLYGRKKHVTPRIPNTIAIGEKGKTEKQEKKEEMQVFHSIDTLRQKLIRYSAREGISHRKSIWDCFHECKSCFLFESRSVYEDFVKLGTLGSGNYSEVRLLCEKLYHRKWFAGKMMYRKGSDLHREGDASDEEIVHEIETMESLNHPNLLKLYRVYRDSDRWALITELACGGTLAERQMHLACKPSPSLRQNTTEEAQKLALWDGNQRSTTVETPSPVSNKEDMQEKQEHPEAHGKRRTPKRRPEPPALVQFPDIRENDSAPNRATRQETSVCLEEEDNADLLQSCPSRKEKEKEKEKKKKETKGKEPQMKSQNSWVDRRFPDRLPPPPSSVSDISPGRGDGEESLAVADFTGSQMSVGALSTVDPVPPLSSHPSSVVSPPLVSPLGKRQEETGGEGRKPGKPGKHACASNDETKQARHPSTPVSHPMNHHASIIPAKEKENRTPAPSVLAPSRGIPLTIQPKRYGAFSEKEAASYFADIVAGVAYLHSHQIGHRDLKPANCLLRSHHPDADVVIGDFGFARKWSEQFPFSSFCGSPHFVAPEVAVIGLRQSYAPPPLNKKETGDRDPSPSPLRLTYGIECDLWSLGCILYLLLSGSFPFEGAFPCEDPKESLLTSKEVLQRVVYGNYDMDHSRWWHVSEEAKSLIDRLLRKSPKSRMSARFLLFRNRWLSDHAPERVRLRQKELQEIWRWEASSSKLC